MNQLQSIFNLYSEILLILAGATLLGWLIGLMMQKSRSKRKLRAVKRTWRSRYKALEDSSKADADNLEEQLQQLAQESKSLVSTNKVLTDSLKKNDTSIQKARAEAIELNRQHAETQERLQRIIQQKDREIVELGHRLNNSSSISSTSGSTHIAPNSTGVIADSLTDINDNELTYADTVAITPAMIPTEAFDATVQLSALERASNASENQVMNDQPSQEVDMEDTADLNGLGVDDMDEATIALDDEALAFAQRSYPARRRD